MLLLNPRRRRRKAKSSHRRRSRARRMTAKQLKYFGKRSRRRSAPRRARRVRSITIRANPIRRRSRRRSASAVRRRFRRNPISSAGLRASLGSVQRVAIQAAVGGAGAIVTDLAYGAALRLLPDTVAVKIASRYGSDGGANFAYYGAKAALAVGLGVAGSMFLPPKLRSYAARGAEGALTVAAYEVMRLSMPAAVSARMGYYSTARVVTGGGGVPQKNLSAYVSSRRLSGMGSMPAGSAVSLSNTYRGDTRVGEGAIS